MKNYSKLTKEEKSFIKAYVKFRGTQEQLFSTDTKWLENDLRKIFDNNDGEHREKVTDYINELILV
jgi:hypothetical protein